MQRGGKPLQALPLSVLTEKLQATAKGILNKQHQDLVTYRMGNNVQDVNNRQDYISGKKIQSQSL